MDEGIGGNTPGETVCEDYTEEEIKFDYEAVDYDTAYEEVERVEEQRK